MRAHRGDAVGHRIDARRRQRQAVDEGGGRAAGAHFRDVLGIGGEDLLPRWRGSRRSIASSARFFCSGGASASTRAAARARRPRSVIKAGKSAVPSMAFSGGGHRRLDGLCQLRPCPSTEIPLLRGRGTGMADGRGRGRTRLVERGPGRSIGNRCDAEHPAWIVPAGASTVMPLIHRRASAGIRAISPGRDAAS